MMKMKIWSCKVGQVVDEDVLDGADQPMAAAVKRAYKELTGKEPDFMFSGWGDSLTEDEREVVEEMRQPT